MRRLAFLVLSVGLAPWPASGQQEERPTFSATAELVVLHVTVRDKRGAYVTGLQQDAFEIVENGRPQEVRFLSAIDTPVTVGLVIDGSGSMLPNRERVIAAAAAFAEASNPRDEMFALAFNNKVRPALLPDAPFTNDPVVLRSALDRSITAYGRTALYDGISAALDYLDEGTHERKALVIVSDGGDNASRGTLDQVLLKTQSSNAVIYTIALIDELNRDANPRLLKDIAQSSGGEAFRPSSPRRIADVFRQIARDIRHTYTVGFVPSGRPDGESLRKVRVSASRTPGERLNVRHRAGYR